MNEKSMNILIGFAFFTQREQAVRLIKYHNYGFNAEKAMTEKVKGGLRIEYFTEDFFAINKSIAFRLRFVKSFKRLGKNHKVGTEIRDFV